MEDREIIVTPRSKQKVVVQLPASELKGNVEITFYRSDPHDEQLIVEVNTDVPILLDRMEMPGAFARLELSIRRDWNS